MEQSKATGNFDQDQKSAWETPKLIEINEDVNAVASTNAGGADGFGTSTS